MQFRKRNHAEMLQQETLDQPGFWLHWKYGLNDWQIRWKQNRNWLTN